MFGDCNMNKILVKHINACSYSVVDLGGLEGYSPPLLATLRNTKTQCIDIKMLNSCIKCHFYTLQIITTHTFRG